MGRLEACRSCGARISIPAPEAPVDTSKQITAMRSEVPSIPVDDCMSGDSSSEFQENDHGKVQGKECHTVKGVSDHQNDDQFMTNGVTNISVVGCKEQSRDSEGTVSSTQGLNTLGAQSCGICQTEIDADDPKISCNKCSLPFHRECWDENLGCSAYGCPNVGILRAGPDIRIGNPPPLPGREALSAQFSATPVKSANSWHYLLLALSSLATLLGLVCYGVFALITMSVSLLALRAVQKKNESSAVLALSGVISVIGFVVGFILSLSLRK